MATGYTDQFRIEREREQEEERKRLEQARSANAAARKAYLDKLEVERQERAARHAAELEAQLEPIREQEMRSWLIEHPGRDADDFAKVWPALREAKYTGREARVAAEIAAQRATGRYRS